MNNKPNRNLLDNWYFGNPVNQRGQTSYNTPGYSIDRWYLQGGSFELSDNALTFLFPLASGGAERFNQQVPIEKFIHGVYTISVLTTEGLYSTTFEFEPGNVVDVQLNIGNGIYIGFATTSSLTRYRLFNVDTSEDISVSFIAAKLELSDHQTLAHQDQDGNWVLNEIPDYGEELARCQRYQLVLRGINTVIGDVIYVRGKYAYVSVPLPVTMRGNTNRVAVTLSGSATLYSMGGNVVLSELYPDSMAISQNIAQVIFQSSADLTSSGIVCFDDNNSELIIDRNL